MEELRAELAVPKDLHRCKLPLTALNREDTLYRIQHKTYDSPLFFGTTGRNRWDCPAGAKMPYGVLYMALDAKAAFYETLGHDIKKQIFSDIELRERALWAIEIERALSLVDLTGDGLARLQVDARLTSTREIAIPQRWSQAFHDHPSGPDGILYVSRHQPQLRCVAVFERSRGKLRPGRVDNLRYWQHPVTGETAVDYIVNRGGEIVIESFLR